MDRRSFLRTGFIGIAGLWARLPKWGISLMAPCGPVPAKGFISLEEYRRLLKDFFLGPITEYMNSESIWFSKMSRVCEDTYTE